MGCSSSKVNTTEAIQSNSKQKSSPNNTPHDSVRDMYYFGKMLGTLMTKKSIIIFPESHEAYSNLSRILLETGQYDLAENYLIKVIKLKPEFLMAYQNLFIVYCRNNNRKKAENVLYDC